MILKQRVKHGRQIRCFNVITNKGDIRYGQKCNRLLLCKNSSGEVAGEIKCPRCDAIYDIKGNFIYLIEKEDKR